MAYRRGHTTGHRRVSKSRRRTTARLEALGQQLAQQFAAMSTAQLQTLAFSPLRQR